jgi:hypothetical protein
MFGNFFQTGERRWRVNIKIDIEEVLLYLWPGLRIEFNLGFLC